jgi:hypothetical protein
VQGELCALAGHPGEQQQQGRRQRGRRVVVREHVTDPETARRDAQHRDAEQEPDVTDPGHHERLHRRLRRLRQSPVVADQQVGADAHDLPADQQHDQVTGHHHEQHRRGEETDLRRVGRVPLVVVQVGHRVDLHRERHDRDRESHVQGGGGDRDTGGDQQVTEAHPLVAGDDPATTGQQQADDDQRPGRPGDAEPGRPPPSRPAAVRRREHQPEQSEDRGYGGQQRPEDVHLHPDTRS